MPRLVRFDATGPLKIDPKTLDPEKTLSICACGLSQKFPICDGAHKTCKDHDPGTLYVYNEERTRVVETRPDPRPIRHESPASPAGDTNPAPVPPTLPLSTQPPPSPPPAVQ